MTNDYFPKLIRKIIPTNILLNLYTNSPQNSGSDTCENTAFGVHLSIFGVKNSDVKK